jgi:hypothetical protein
VVFQKPYYTNMYVRPGQSIAEKCKLFGYYIPLTSSQLVHKAKQRIIYIKIYDDHITIISYYTVAKQTRSEKRSHLYFS